MIFHQSLNQILDSRVKVRILRFLCRKGGEWNGRRLAAELALNPVTTHAALRALHQATLLDFRKVGNNFIYSLRDEHFLVREILRPLFQKEMRTQERLLELLKQGFPRRLRASVVTVALYGSVARHQERPTSDIDLLVLVSSERAKREAAQTIDSRWDTVMKEFGNALAPYIITVTEIRQKYQQRLPLVRGILAHHQIILGRSLEEILHDKAA